MIPRVKNLEKISALKKALQTLALGNIELEDISEAKAVFLGPNISEEQIKILIDFIAGWIGRTPIARYAHSRLVISY